MCENCPYHYAVEDERFPRCHFEGPEGWAPCEWEEEEEEDEDYPELIFDPEEEEDENE